MIGAGIDDGDLVLIRQQNTAEPGQIVVALMEDEATLKKYFPEPENHRVRLYTGSRQFIVARFPEDCSADTSAGGERGVGGVDDSVSVENGDAGFLDGYGAHVHFSMTVKSLN